METKKTIKMKTGDPIVERLIDTIFLEFGGRIIQMIDIPMETNCAPLLADLFLYLNESHGSRQTNALPNNSISPTDIQIMYYLKVVKVSRIHLPT